MLKLPEEIKTKWVAALRGGQYEQVQESLKKQTPTGIGFCCLGVLCDIQPGFVWRAVKADPDANQEYKTQFGSDSYPLPGDVGEEVHAVLAQNISDPDHDRLGTAVAVSVFLAEHNDANSQLDRSHWDFPRIANWIEENL